jgi:hypothetical protein
MDATQLLSDERPALRPSRQRWAIVFTVLLVITVVGASVAVSVWRATADDNCSDAMSGRVCENALKVEGADGRLPTAEQVLEELAPGYDLVYAWHLNADVFTEPTIPAGDSLLHIFAGCAGDGMLVVTATNDGEPIATMRVGCDGSIGPGKVVNGLVTDEAGARKLVRRGPFSLSASTQGEVTDAEYFVLGSPVV